MARRYTAKQGQTVDLICLEHYGRTASVTELVLEANPGLAELGPFPPVGTVIVLPDVEVRARERELVKLWD